MEGGDQVGLEEKFFRNDKELRERHDGWIFHVLLA